MATKSKSKKASTRGYATKLGIGYKRPYRTPEQKLKAASPQQIAEAKRAVMEDYRFEFDDTLVEVADGIADAVYDAIYKALKGEGEKPPTHRVHGALVDSLHEVLGYGDFLPLITVGEKRGKAFVRVGKSKPVYFPAPAKLTDYL